MQPRWHRLLGFVFPVPSSQVGKIALTIFRWHLCAASHINCSDPASWIFDEYICSNDFRWIDNTDNSNQNQPKTNRANISHIYNFFELQTSNRIELILNRPFFFSFVICSVYLRNRLLHPNHDAFGQSFISSILETQKPFPMKICIGFIGKQWSTQKKTHPNKENCIVCCWKLLLLLLLLFLRIRFLSLLGLEAAPPIHSLDPFVLFPCFFLFRLPFEWIYFFIERFFCQFRNK